MGLSLSSLKRFIITFFALFVFLLMMVSCDNEIEGQGDSAFKPFLNYDPTVIIYPPSKDVSDAPEEDTYSIHDDPCVECEYYFCPPMNSMWQMQICLNTCEDPNTVVFQGECKELLECNPAQVLLETDIPCVTDDGYPGFKDKICNKGQILYTDCKTECTTEVCDNKDNDCDGEIDEDVKNVCGECGEVPEEVCDYIDNDCDGEIDEGVANACGECGSIAEEVCNGIDDDCEDLIQECSTVCEKDLEYCISGSWICTAKQPLQEICNGLDDDCDGKVDEGLDCLCTVQDIGTLLPCKEKPLVCGEGFKTCECKNADCTELGLTECLAVCHWLPQVLPPGETCDKYKGIVKPEECNNHDDNCNQSIDEGLTKLCYEGPNATVYVGICLPGEMFCESGAWGAYTPNGDFMDKLCLGQVLPEDEDI